MITDEQLNEKIAKAKGWQPICIEYWGEEAGLQKELGEDWFDTANGNDECIGEHWINLDTHSCEPDEGQHNYTSDWRLAGELLEEVVKDGINSYTVYCDGGGYYSCEIRIAGDKRVTFCEADTPQRAICEAWLKWKGIEI